MRRGRGAAVAAVALVLAGCDAAPPDADAGTSSALAISSAKQLAAAVGCVGYTPIAPAGFNEGGDCTVGGVAFHLYVFTSNSDRNALVNGIFRTSADVKYAIGDSYVIASLDAATTRTAAAKIGATVQ